MELRRYVRKTLLSALTLAVLWVVPVFAAMQDCPSDSMTDENNKDIAKQALADLQQTKTLHQKFTQDFEKVFNNSNGVCNYLKGSLQFNLKNWAQMNKEDVIEKMNLGNHAPKGVEVGDKLLGGNNLSTTYKSFVNSDNSLDGTDINVSRLISRATTGVAGVKALLEWATNPANQAEGTSMKVDPEASEILETIYDFSIDCKEAVMLGGGEFKCVQGVLPSVDEIAADLQSLDISDIKNLIWNGGTIGGVTVPPTSGVAAVAALALLGGAGALGAVSIGTSYKLAEWVLQQAGALTAFTDSVSGFSSKVSKIINNNQCAEALTDINNTRTSLSKMVGETGNKLAVLSGEVEISCKCDDTTKEVVSCDAIDDSIIQDGLDALQMCKTVTDYEREFTDECFSCELFANIMGAVQKISKNSFEATSDALIGLLVIGFLIYVAYQTLITIASPEAQKLSKYLTTLLLQGTKVAVTILILQNPTFLYNKLLSPILESSVDFGMSLTGTNSVKAAETGKKYAKVFDASNEYLSARTAQIMVGAVENFSNGATTMPSIGRGFVCYSWKDLGWFYRMNVIPRFGMLTEGAILFIAGVGIWLAIGFYMLDCAIELGIVCALMSFFVACWPFKMTTGYTKIGWNMFLNVFFNFVMMGIIVATILGISGQALSVGITQDELINLVNSDDIPGLEASIQLGGLQTLMVLICCFMCFKLPGEAGKLASRFAGGAQLGGMGGEVGATIAGAATNAAVGQTFGKDGKLGGSAGLALKGAKAWGKSVGEHTGASGAIKAQANKVKQFAQGVKGKVGLGAKASMGAKGRNQNANQQKDEITNGFSKDE